MHGKRMLENFILSAEKQGGMKEHLIFPGLLANQEAR